MKVFHSIERVLSYIRDYCFCKQLKHINQTTRISHSVKVFNPDNLYMDENINIDAGGVIMNTRARFIVKKNSGAAIGL